MPKKKTRKSFSKRVKVTAGGKLVFARPGKGHLLSCKSAKRKRRLRRGATVGHADQKRLKALL